MKPQAHGDGPLVREADDFRGRVQAEPDAENIAPAMRERFTKFGLPGPPERTRVIRRDRKGRGCHGGNDPEHRTFDIPRDLLRETS